MYIYYIYMILYGPDVLGLDLRSLQPPTATTVFKRAACDGRVLARGTGGG